MAPTLSLAPKDLLGFVDDHSYGGLLYDVFEYVPELAWPSSVPAFNRMRRDPQLAAVLAGYTLQLRRASWQLDGTGCRPAATQMVADDLGLPIVGKDRPTGARTRGVSWNNHLRSALGHLVYGHYGFEMAADVSSGKARLTTLAERPPHTISNIHVDPKSGDLVGITQTMAARQDVPQIRAKNLVWYSHDREGIMWTGTSLLRPAYGAWLIKREMIKVHAGANRRWGMGVPVMEAHTGSNPTAGQMQDAQRLASAARAGDTAGAASPPGFTLAIKGLSGSVPDTVAFLRWLDQQMSRMALMGFLDLGETPNGSRALGQSFVDYLVLALQSIGEDIADTATRQAAARITAWNFGEDEPVPQIKVSGIGSQREVTAESLQLLLDSGALAADPALEEWVRREYRLPERTTPWPDPTKTATRPAPKPVEPVEPAADDAEKPATDGGNPAGSDNPADGGQGKKKPADPKTTTANDVEAVAPPDRTGNVAAAEWTDAKHPRDQSGRFARKGGGGQLGKPLSDAEFNKRSARLERAMADAIKTQSTDRLYADEHGAWHPDRDKIHREIAAAIFAKAADVPNDGKALVAGGLGGAGKSTVLRKHAGVDQSQYLTLNPDDVKEEMAARGLIPELPGEDVSPMERAALIHEESSRITKLVADMAYREKKNVIWDITMSSPSSVRSRLADLRRHGYDDMRGVFVDIPAETSVDRAMARYRRGVDSWIAGKGHGGRFVPPSIIRAQRTSSGMTINRGVFDGMRNEFDTWSVYDNSGQSAVLVEESV